MKHSTTTSSQFLALPQKRNAIHHPFGTSAHDNATATSLPTSKEGSLCSTADLICANSWSATVNWPYLLSSSSWMTTKSLSSYQPRCSTYGKSWFQHSINPMNVTFITSAAQTPFTNLDAGMTRPRSRPGKTTSSASSKVDFPGRWKAYSKSGIRKVDIATN